MFGDSNKNPRRIIASNLEPGKIITSTETTNLDLAYRLGQESNSYVLKETRPGSGFWVVDLAALQKSTGKER